MPGWFAAVEALQRGQHHVVVPEQIKDIQILACGLYSLPSVDALMPTLPQSISLAATLRKVLWPHIQCDAVPESRRRTLGAEEGVSWRDTQRRKLQSLDVDFLMAKMVASVLALDQIVENIAGCDTIAALKSIDSNMQTDSGGSSSTTTTSQTSTPCSSNFVDALASGMPEHGQNSSISHHTSHHSNNTSRALAQLQAITLLTVVQLALWVHHYDSADHAFRNNHVGWMLRIVMTCTRIKNVPLMILVVATLSVIGAEKLHPTEALPLRVEWERHAVANFSGRLLPGCCYLGCADVSGVSEAALATQLCGGCRRARYCSTRCQRAAWLEGGHSTVCRDT